MAFIKFDGGYYEGEAYSGIPDGEGSAHYDNGNYYCGQWSYGKYYGKGKFVNSNGSWYEGEFFNNDMHGEGIYHFANGERFEGTLKDGRLVKGTFYYTDGYKYSGTFDEQERQHGKGTLYYPNGDYYKGEWQHGKRHGEGELYCNYGVTEKCRFVDDKGEGTFIFDYPFIKIKEVRNFKDDKPVSRSSFYDYNGNPIDYQSICLRCVNGNYIGGIKDGKRHGKGMFWFDDKRCYVGEFKDGSLNGPGIMYYDDGKRLIGTWERGRPQGRGVWYFTNGTKSLAKYENGKQVYLGKAIAGHKDFPEDKASSSGKKSKKNKYGFFESETTVEYPEGKYVGNRYYGKRGGFGTMYYHDGSYFVGCWKKDKMHGEGKMYFPKTIIRKNPNGSEIKFEKGSRIEGIWKNSKNGKHMTLILPNGTKKSIRFSHGNFILK